MSRAPTRTDYAVLGLRPGAGDDEIRDAYRRLAKIHHPDRNPGDPQALATFRPPQRELRGAARPAASGRLGSDDTAVGGARRGAPRRAAPRRSRPSPSPTFPSAGPPGWRPTRCWWARAALAALRPAASGTAFPSAERVIRVERRR